MAPPSARAEAAAAANSSSLDDATKQLKQRYSKQLTQARELFPDWSDEDLLNALQEANGDVELAILRISEGQSCSLCQAAINGLQSHLVYVFWETLLVLQGTCGFQALKLLGANTKRTRS